MNGKQSLKVSIFCVLLSGTHALYPIIEPVKQFVRRNLGGSRQQTVLMALELAEKRNVKTIVETGTARGGELAFCGDGGFTIIFGYWSSLNGVDLHSVDISAHSIKRARTMITQYEKNVHLVQDDSVHFLKQFDKPIDFLYLDSFDFDTKNPEPSQLHHLHEIEAAYEKLTPNAIVMIDDCGLPHGGKGKFVIDYLLKKGWRKYAESYQVIMVRS